MANFIPPVNGASLGSYFLPKRGYVDFFFQLNLLPPYSIHSQGDKMTSTQWTLIYFYDPTPWFHFLTILLNWMFQISDKIKLISIQIKNYFCFSCWRCHLWMNLVPLIVEWIIFCLPWKGAMKRGRGRCGTFQSCKLMYLHILPAGMVYITLWYVHVPR